eukprot:TRINITY_DN32113_c0_g1_i1.p1 TRINITY_DN32113_c0_g1~~TRINITY_DN32113_c0_g1_i1.p1  ORF type:complete len:302 (-),score=32.50 TRINITY_DN32113_c0_g1_i1:176-952(-)
MLDVIMDDDAPVPIAGPSAGGPRGNLGGRLHGGQMASSAPQADTKKRTAINRITGAAAPFLPEAAPDDLPLCAKDVIPEDVRPIPFVMMANFHLKVEVNLKRVAFGIRHAEYNPRKHGSITVRLMNPRTTALIRASGSCAITGTMSDPEELKHSGKKVARLVQRCGMAVKFTEWKVCSLLCKVDLGFPVRLDSLTARYRLFAIYEPETYSGCIFKLRKPRWTYNITAGGKMILTGIKNIQQADDALRRIYPVLREFRH